MEQISEQTTGYVASYAPVVIGAVGILIVGWIFSRMLSLAARRALTTAHVDPTLVGFAGSLVYVILLAGVVIAALQRVGVPTGSFLGVVGAAGLAIGLALKGTMSNLAAGIMLIALRPIQVGDRIEAAGAHGVIEEIHVFATTIRADDRRRIIVPNAAITGGNITKHTTA